MSPPISSMVTLRLTLGSVVATGNTMPNASEFFAVTNSAVDWSAGDQVTVTLDALVSAAIGKTTFSVPETANPIGVLHTYRRWEVIRVTLPSFTAPVTVSSTGRPFIYLVIGGDERITAFLASEQSGTTTSDFTFVYYVEKNGPQGRVGLCQPVFGLGCTGQMELGGATLTDPRGFNIYRQVPTELSGYIAERYRVDSSGPALRSATVRGSELVLDFDEMVSLENPFIKPPVAHWVPPASAFRVFYGRLAAWEEPSAVDFDVFRRYVDADTGREVVERTFSGVRLTLSRAAKFGEEIAIGYMPRGRDRLRDWYGQPASRFARHPVRNDTPEPTQLQQLQQLLLKGITLRPPFNPGVESYEAVVAHDFPAVATLETDHAEEIGVTMTPAADADPDSPGHQVRIASGQTEIRVEAASSDGETRKTYTVQVFRLPEVTLTLAPSSISENGGTAVVRASAAGAAQRAFSVRVAPHADVASGATHDQYTLSGDAMLHFAQGAMTSTEPVTITAVDNRRDNPDRRFFVIGINSEGANPDFLVTGANPEIDGVHELLIVDDDDPESPYDLTAKTGIDAIGSVQLSWHIDPGGSYRGYDYRWGAYTETLGIVRIEHWSEEIQVEFSGDEVEQATVSEGLYVGEPTMFEVRRASRFSPRERVRATPLQLPAPTVSIAAVTTGSVEHGRVAEVTDQTVATYELTRDGDTTLGLSNVRMRFSELDRELVAPRFEPGESTVQMRHPAWESVGDQPLCAITYEVLDNDHYEVTPGNLATVEVRGPGTTCAATTKTMTVGQPAGTGGPGYGPGGDNPGEMLPNNTFEHESLLYSILKLVYSNGELQLTLSRSLPDGIGFKVDNTRVTFALDSTEGTPHLYTATFDHTPWIVGQTVEVEIFPAPMVPRTRAVGEPLSARLEVTPPGHDGANAFTLRLAFSEPVATSAEAMRERVFDVTGGEVTAASPVEGRRDLWDITVRPTSRADVVLLLPITESCDAKGAVCTADGNGLANALSVDVARLPLTVEAAEVPAGHDGSSAFTLRLAFSEPIATSAAALRDDALSVTGGSLTGVRRVDGRSDLWEVALDPAGDGEVELSLPPTVSECDAKGAVCTDDGNPLQNEVRASVARSSVARSVLTARFENVPDAHDGAESFTVGLAFSEPVGTSYKTLRDHAFAVTHGRVTGARRVNGRSDLWTITIAPSSGADITVSLPGTASCDDEGAVCTEDGRPLSNSPSDTVEGPPAEPLTASFSGMPAEHDGESVFTFSLTFSEEPREDFSYRTLRDHAFDVSGGAVRKAPRQQQGSNQAWTIHVEPSGRGAVSIRLPATSDCSASGAICTGDGRPLSNAPSDTVAGPAALSVADAQAEENTDATLDFTVTLDRTASATVTVDYATADGTATAGVDYTAARGTLTFQAGARTQTVAVTLLDDTHDEGEETFTLALSNASGAVIADGEATGTIKNSDPLPRALMARFGRAAAVHVVEHVEERLQAPREPGFRGRFAGRELRKGMERDMAIDFLGQLWGAGGANPAGAGVHDPMSGAPGAGATPMGTPGLAGGGAAMGMAGPMGAGMGPGAMGAEMGTGSMSAGLGPAGGLNGQRLFQMGLGGGDMLTGSAFELNRQTRQGGILSFWSRGAQSSFHGREGALALNGEVRTAMFGADYAKGRMVAGLSLARSQSLGGYQAETAGQVQSAVTGLYPWLGYQLSDRVSVWGVTGYGSGALRLTPGSGAPLESALSMAMAAGGTRGDLVAGGAGGFALAFKADALWVGTSIDGTDGPEGRLNATGAAVTRVRAGLEGSRDFTLGSVLSLKPLVEVGLRHDGGDAETGAGIDVGSGVTVSAPAVGLSVDVRVRMLLVHQADGFQDRGMSMTLSYTPAPSTPLGFSARVAPSWGGQATGGAQALWDRETMAGLAQSGVAAGNRLDGEVGYGLSVGSRFVGTPRIGLTTSEYGRDYRLGYGMTLLEQASLGFELAVDAQRRESPMPGGTDHGVLGQATLGW